MFRPRASDRERVEVKRVKQAESGAGVVREAVAAMEGISESSTRIGNIIGVTDEIAFQTNLLALNAAVEAARTGDQGRGFAVVASEVRELAGRSATAAREIKALIEDSSAKVGEGVRLVDASGQALDRMPGSMTGVTDVVAEIAQSSQQQYAGIEQVNEAVRRIEEITQRNATLTEESTSATEMMRRQAGCLSELVSFFQVNRPDRQVRAAG